jgi:hypothetical protein
MKILSNFAVAALLLLQSASSAVTNTIDSLTAESAGLHEEYLQSQFFVWAQQHGKMYASEEEAQIRLGIWKDNHGALDTFW